MADFLPKPDLQFRVGHGHGRCGSSSSSSSSSSAPDRRRRRSDLISRRADEIITTMERRNRESELMALASLRTVIESSFLRPESPPPERRPPPEHVPSAAASSILRRWRELEEEARAARSGLSSREQSPDAGEGERERERERVREIIRGMTESARASPESPRAEWLGETERERVRRVRELVQTATQRRDDERERRIGGRRAPVRVREHRDMLESLRRIARERQSELQGLSEHRAVSSFAHRNRIQVFLSSRFVRNEELVQDERSPSVGTVELGQLHQRHLVSGSREGLQYEVENNAPGPARNLLDGPAIPNNNGSQNVPSQSTTTMEFSVENHVEYDDYQLRSRTNDIHRPIEALATTELEENIPNETTDWQEYASQGENWQEEDTEHEERQWQHSGEIGFTDWPEGTGEESDMNRQENIDQEWSRDAAEDEDVESQENDEWHEDDAHESLENWRDGPSDQPRDQQSVPLRRVSRFIPPDDDNVYSIELRELLSRRNVSNLLRSGFRESLDQLIQSYVQRQDHTPLNWLERPLTSPDSPVEDQDLERDDRNQEQQGVARPRHTMPSPPVPPPQPLWHLGLRHSNWTQQRVHRSEIEWDIINDIKADMTKLQQGMSHMQRMLETCMDMQLELQRAVRQEVSAALNRSIVEKGLGEETSDDGSKWGHVRKGTCCVCCDSHIDALLFRCGHMCTCSKCGHELVRSGGKCPLCRAPIIEVIRAYSIM